MNSHIRMPPSTSLQPKAAHAPEHHGCPSQSTNHHTQYPVLRSTHSNERDLVRPSTVSRWERVVSTFRFIFRSLSRLTLQEPDPTKPRRPTESYPPVTYIATTFRDFAIVCDPYYAKAIIELPRFPDSEDALVKEGKPFIEVRNALSPSNMLSCPAAEHTRFRKHADKFFNKNNIDTLGIDILAQTKKQIEEWKDGSCINISREIPKFTARVIAKHGIGYDGPIEQITYAVEEVMRYIAQRLFRVPSLWLRIHHVAMRILSPIFGWRPPLTEEEAHSILETAVQRSLNTAKHANRSYLQTMATAKNDSGDPQFSLGELASTAKMLFFAGQETTQSALVWAIYQLGIHPEWQKRVFKEWTESELDETSFVLNNRTLWAITKETLRLNPPAYQQPRRAQQDLVLGERYFIPKETGLIISHYFHQRDPIRWAPDAGLFRPERFLQSELVAKGHHAPWVAFGAGKNSCLGKSLAMLELRTFIFSLIRSNQWEVTDRNVQQKGFISLGTDRDVLINLRSRK